MFTDKHPGARRRPFRKAAGVFLMGVLGTAGPAVWAGDTAMMDTFDNFRVSAEKVQDPSIGGWRVDTRLGQLSVNIPIRMMPGEIAFPVSLSIIGLPSTHLVPAEIGEQEHRESSTPIYGAIDFPRPVSSFFNLGFLDKASGSEVYRFEDGRVYDGFDFYYANDTNRLAGFTPSGLFAAFGLPVPDIAGLKLDAGISSDGKVFMTPMMTTSNVLGTELAALLNSTTVISPFTSNNSECKVCGTTWNLRLLMDQDRARFFQVFQVYQRSYDASEKQWEDLDLGTLCLPRLIIDRFHHYVKFNWSRSGNLVRVDVTNQRGQGFTVRQWVPDFSSFSQIRDLARLDFVNVSGPSVLVQGYDSRPINVANDCPSPISFPVYPVQNLGQPTTVTLGDPGAVSQPSWSDPGNAVAMPPATLALGESTPQNRVWTFGYDTNLVSLASVVDPLGCQSLFTTTTYSLVHPFLPNVFHDIKPDLVTGVTRVVQSDTSGQSGATRTQTWARQLTTNAISVQHTDVWGNGSPDRLETYAYGDVSNSGANNSTDYGNGFLTAWTLADGSGNVMASETRQSVVASRGTYGGGLNHSESFPTSMTLARAQEATRQTLVTYDTTNWLQPLTVEDRAGGTRYQLRSTTFNTCWDMLDPIQMARSTVIRYQLPGGAALSPDVTTSNLWNTQAQLTQTSRSGGNSYQHGSQFTYDASGRLATRSVYHQEGGSTLAAPNTETITYDDQVTGMPISWTTGYQDVNCNRGSIVKLSDTFDNGFRPTREVDERGVVTITHYDLFGRPISIQKDGEADISISYPSLWTKQTTQAGKTTTETTDGFGRSILQVLPDGRHVVPTYDSDNRVVQVTETNSAGVSRSRATTYDTLDRVTQQTSFDGITTSFAYSTNGTWNWTTQTVGVPQPALVTTTARDPFGLPMAVQDPLGIQTVYSYDGWGNRTSVTILPNVHGTPQTRTFTYDSLGRLVSQCQPETGTQTFSNFNALNLAGTFIEGAGTATPRIRTRVFDGLGRMRSETSGTTTETYTYTGALLTGSRRTTGSNQVDRGFAYQAPGARLSQETTNSSVVGAW